MSVPYTRLNRGLSSMSAIVSLTRMASRTSDKAPESIITGQVRGYCYLKIKILLCSIDQTIHTFPAIHNFYDASRRELRFMFCPILQRRSVRDEVVYDAIFTSLQSLKHYKLPCINFQTNVCICSIKMLNWF